MSGELLLPGATVVTRRTRRPCEISTSSAGAARERCSGPNSPAIQSPSSGTSPHRSPTGNGSHSRSTVVGRRRAGPSCGPSTSWRRSRPPGFGYVMALRPVSLSRPERHPATGGRVPLAAWPSRPQRRRRLPPAPHRGPLLPGHLAEERLLRSERRRHPHLRQRQRRHRRDVGGGVLGTPRYMAPEIVGERGSQARGPICGPSRCCSSASSSSITHSRASARSDIPLSTISPRPGCSTATSRCSSSIR